MRRLRLFPRARKNLAYVCLGGLSFAAAASCGARSEVDRSPFSGTGASTGVVASSGTGVVASSGTGGSVASSGTGGSVASSGTGAGGTLDVASSSAAGGSCGIGYDETVTAKLVLTADDQFALYAQGKFIEEPKANWKVPHSYELPLFRHPSRPNVLAVRVSNLFKVDGRDRGLLLKVTVPPTGSSEEQTLSSDGSWRAAGKEVSGWETADVSSSGWPFAVVEAADGANPWGFVLGDPQSKWIWSYDSNKPAVAKVEKEVVYFRRDFYVGLDGKLSDKPGSCL